MNITQKKLSEAGSKGASNRWTPIRNRRYDMLVELSRYLDKKSLNRVMGKSWTNEFLEALIKSYENIKKHD